MIAMGKITRVRSGCWTCKRRHKKCDERRPSCFNCASTKRVCEGYDLRLTFDVDDHRHNDRKDKSGRLAKGFVGKPKSKILSSEEGLVAFKSNIIQSVERPPTTTIKTLHETRTSDNPHEKHVSFVTPDLGDLPNEDKLGLSLELIEDLESLLGAQYGPETLGSVNSARTIPKHANAIKKSSSRMLKQVHNRFESKVNKITHHSEESLFELSYEEENILLRHFFEKLLPLLDAHPCSPWPDLALKYCDFDIARSCFISLACIHMYESKKGGTDLYNKAVAHIDMTLEYLLNFIKCNSEDKQVNALNLRAKKVTSFAILVLINVHILFSVLDKGKSKMVRFLYKVFASICEDSAFYDEVLVTNDKWRALVVVLSWYDTICAMVSTDSRLPFCSPTWYGSSSDVVSTAEMMGCPGEIFKCMSKVCFLRHERKCMLPRARCEIEAEFKNIAKELLNYREYVDISENEHEYLLKLKGAQCWALAVYVTLCKVVKPSDYEVIVRKTVIEFISVYSSMDPSSPIVTQMVWPIYAIGCECKSNYEKDQMLLFMDSLYENAQMGTLYFVKSIVSEVWKSGEDAEELLIQYLDAGEDFLPL